MSKKRTGSSLVEDNRAMVVIRPIPGMIQVSSINEYGFTVTTTHISAGGAEWERAQRVAQGHKVLP